MAEIPPKGLIQDGSQKDRSLALLQSRQPAWTPAPDLSKISLQYCRVIAGLRRRGFVIENKVEIKNGVRHGFYRLVTPAPKPLVRQEDSQPALFQSLPARHVDEG
jgi:hypothetical protein